MALRQGWEHHQTLALKILAKGTLLHPPLQAPSVQQMPFAPGLFEFQQDQGPKIQALLAIRRIQGPVNGQTLPFNGLKGSGVGIQSADFVGGCWEPGPASPPPGADPPPSLAPANPHRPGWPLGRRWLRRVAKRFVL